MLLFYVSVNTIKVNMIENISFSRNCRFYFVIRHCYLIKAPTTGGQNDHICLLLNVWVSD